MPAPAGWTKMNTQTFTIWEGGGAEQFKVLTCNPEVLSSNSQVPVSHSGASLAASWIFTLLRFIACNTALKISFFIIFLFLAYSNKIARTSNCAITMFSAMH